MPKLYPVGDKTFVTLSGVVYELPDVDDVDDMPYSDSLYDSYDPTLYDSYESY